MSNVPPTAPQAMLFIFGGAANTPYVGFIGIQLYFDLASALMMLPTITTGPSHTIQLPIPNNASLKNARVVVQDIVITKPVWEATAASASTLEDRRRE